MSLAKIPSSHSLLSPAKSKMPSLKGTAAAFVAVLPMALGLYKNGSMMAPCDSEIYCHGEMLKQIQLAKPFTDSKTFVDM